MEGTSASSRHRWRPFLALVAAVGAALAWWATLAPTWLGGPVAAVVVSGTSMQPRLHTGDVVVVHREPAYHIGELVVSKVDGGRVVHPLYAGNAKVGWRTKGINRRSPDSWVVPERDIVGRYWFMLPQAGRWAADLRSPTGLGALFGALAFLVVFLPARRRRSRRGLTLGQQMRKMKKAMRDNDNLGAPHRPATPTAFEAPALALIGLLGAVGVVVDVASWEPASGFLGTSPLRLHGASAVLVLAATALAVALSALLSARVFLAWGGAPADRAAARLRERLVTVRHLDLTGRVVAVPTAKALLRVAQLSVSPVLQLVEGAHQVFAVVDGETLYVLDLAEEIIDLTAGPEVEAASSRVLPTAGALA